MKESTPLVTIITPTYNRADFLAETINSVLIQDYPNMEYIVLDDGSTDDTLSVLESFKDRLIWEKHPNMGEVRTVNKGFSMAHGEITGVVNSDDPLLPHAINSITKLLIDRPNIGVVYPDWNMISANGELIQHVETYEYDFLNMLRWHHCMPGPGTFFRKEIVDSLQGRDPQFRYVSDFDFWLRAGLITDFARIPMTLATFRTHPGSASSSQTNELMAEEHVQLINKIYALPNITNGALKVKKEAYSSAYYIAGCVCQTCKPSRRKKYFIQALAFCPVKYLIEYRKKRLIEVIIPVTLGLNLLIPKKFRVYFKNPAKIIAAIKRIIRIA